MAEKILIIDDDVDTLRLVGLMLQRQGYEISAASNGTQGLAKALEERPNLILLDVMMPDMDGYEVTRRLRKNPVTVSIPILMFTAKTQLDDKVIGFEVGADDYLTKPTHPTELQAHVKVLLARQKDVAEIVTSSKEHVGYVVGVLSARGGLGVSSVAANLAAAMAQTGQRVILVDADLRRPTLHQMFGVGNNVGLTTALLDTGSELSQHLQATALPNLALLTSGPLPPNPSELLSSSRMSTLLHEMGTQADAVILDSAPVLAVADAAILAHLSDGTLLVIDATRTRRGTAQRAAAQLQRTGAHVLGVVLNRVARSENAYDRYYGERSSETLAVQHRPTQRPG